MVATKRVASPRKSRPSKSAKTDAADDCTPVLAALAVAEAEGLASQCAEVLRLAAPFALQTLRQDRHPYQTAIVGSIEAAVANAEAARQVKVERAQAAIEEHAKRVEENGTELTSAKEKAAASKESKERQYTAEQEAAAAAVAAEAGLDVTTKKLEAHNAEVLAKRAEKEVFEKTKGETWEKLKAASFTGKEWRQRDKEIIRVVQMLQKPGLAASLEVSLETALKQKVDERGPYAVKALEFGDSIWEKFIATLALEIEGFSAVGAECEGAVAEAEKTLQEARAVKSAAAEAAIQADNAWADLETRVYEIADFAKKADLRAGELQGELGTASGELESLRELKISFEALRDQCAELADIADAPELETRVAAPVLA